MANKIFISFRFEDGYDYKKSLVNIFDLNNEIINCSESVDRSQMSEDTIKKHLYNKLKTTSVTIVLLTPKSLNYKKNWFGQIDDWMYDELKYSLDDRDGNRSNAVIAVYTPETKNLILENSDIEGVTMIKKFENLVYENMFNVKNEYKYNILDKNYNSDYDHYCSLISWEKFVSNPNKYIAIAVEKKNNIDHYNIKKRMETKTTCF